MAGFIHFWKMTPAEYNALSVAEHTAMFRHMERVIEAKNRAARQANRGRARGRVRRR